MLGRQAAVFLLLLSGHIDVCQTVLSVLKYQQIHTFYKLHDP